MLGARSHFPLMSPAENTLVYSNARAYPLVSPSEFTTLTWVPSMTIPIVNGVNPLQTTLLELGIVSGRVALLLRSAEIQPVFGRFSTNGIRHFPSLPWSTNATGRAGCCTTAPVAKCVHVRSVVQIPIKGVRVVDRCALV